MRLVDADKVYKEAKTCRETTDSFQELIDSAQTINAIPVEWLRGIMLEYACVNTPEHRAYAFCLNNIIDEWQKEQEAGS